jgi:acyl carrier protein
MKPDAGASASPPPAPADLTARVIHVVAEALDRKPEEILLHSSLVDDLGAESIDFMDIVFRLEDELGVQIPDDDLWRGAFPAGELTPAALEEGVAALRQRLPDFRWDRFPDGVAARDLPRLATVGTIVTYLERRLPELPRLPDAGAGHDRPRA